MGFFKNSQFLGKVRSAMETGTKTFLVEKTVNFTVPTRPGMQTLKIECQCYCREHGGPGSGPGAPPRPGRSEVGHQIHAKKRIRVCKLNMSRGYVFRVRVM